MTSSDPLWIAEADVVSIMTLSDAMRSLEKGLREEHAGRAINMAKTHATWGNGDTLHAIGAVFGGLGWFGSKTWGHTHGGATPLFLLWEAATGRLAAVIEAFALGQMRTGGICGVATHWMADPQADELAIIGSGKQALAQVAAIAAVRPLHAVRVFSPTAENRRAFVEVIKAREFRFAVTEAASVEEAVRDVPIITTVTRARVAFLDAPMVAAGAHINAVGAITPERRELSPGMIARCVDAVVDEPNSAQRLASEFVDHFGAIEKGWKRVAKIADVIDRATRPEKGKGVSIFKAMGMGISDLALAVEIHQRARANGRGRHFPHPVRSEPNFKE